MIQIPVSNPLKFRPLTGQTDVNFDNEFDRDNQRYNRKVIPFCQIWRDDFMIQVVSDVDTVLYLYRESETYVASFPVSVFYQNGNYYHTFMVSGTIQDGESLILSDGTTDLFRSEPIRNASGDVLKVEWFNSENSYLAEYFNSGFVGKLYLNAVFVPFQPTGESTVFDNQGSEIKLKEIIQRVFKLTAEVPAYLAEVLTIALSHDHFYINDVEFIAPKKATVTQIGNSNIYKFESELQETIVLGVNSDDSEYAAEYITGTNILNFQKVSQISPFTIDCPDGYAVGGISAMVVYGSGGNIYAGTTESGIDIAPNTVLTNDSKVHLLSVTDSDNTAKTVYVSITGGISIDINIQLIKS